MNIRTVRERDIDRLKEIHSKFFQEEFSFPNFLQGFLFNFIAEHEGEIVVAGGVRNIAEIVMITDKDQKILDKRLALYKALGVAEEICKRMGFDQIHAFVQNPLWEQRLKKTGFQPTKGHSLVLEI